MVRPATEIVLNPHSVAVDDADLPVRSKVRRPTVPQRYGAPGSSAVALTSAITRCVCATVVTGIYTSIAGSVSAAVVCACFRHGYRASSQRDCRRPHRDRRRSLDDSQKRPWPGPAQRPEYPFGHASFRGSDPIHGWERQRGPGYWSGLDYSRVSTCSPDSVRCCPHANTEIVRDAKIRIELRRTLRLRVRKPITASRFLKRHFREASLQGLDYAAVCCYCAFPTQAHPYRWMLASMGGASKLRQFRAVRDGSVNKRLQCAVKRRWSTAG